MASAAQRRTDRVSMTFLLEASGKDVNGEEFTLPARTIQINQAGAVILLERELRRDQTIQIRRKASSEAHRGSEARVISQLGKQEDGQVYSIELLQPDNDVWGIDFPEIRDEEAVARMLLECNYCRAKEVMYLNQVELRGFETARGIARYCKSCGVPTIWAYAVNEDEKKIASRAARGRRGQAAPSEIPTGGEQRERQRMRLKTRLTACIRQPSTDDELAICEDISPVGMCFRSKRRYEAQSALSVAVPYSPQAANIFLQARVIYCEEIPKAGMFRHGVEYVKSSAPQS
jgi:PilZ domain